MAELLHAAFEGRLEDVERLVDEGIDVNYSDAQSGNTSLHLASMEENLDIVRYLISKGADLNQKNGYGLTPLQEVCCEVPHSIELVDLLISSGSNVDELSNNQNTALEIVIGEKCPETAKRLILAGADYEKLLNKYHEYIDKGVETNEYGVNMIMERDMLESLVLELATFE